MIAIYHKATFRLRCFVGGRVLSWVRTAYLRALGMRIGQQTHVGKLAVSWPHKVSIGQSCMIEDGVSFKFDGIWQPGASIRIGNHCFVGRGTEFNIRKEIRIGDHSAIASGCKFIDHDHGITGEKLDETPGLEKEIVIGAHAWLGANVIVLKGVTIGNGAVVGAGSVATKAIPAREVWAGVPARRIATRKEISVKSLIQLVQTAS